MSLEMIYGYWNPVPTMLIAIAISALLFLALWQFSGGDRVRGPGCRNLPASLHSARPRSTGSRRLLHGNSGAEYRLERCRSRALPAASIPAMARPTHSTCSIIFSRSTLRAAARSNSGLRISFLFLDQTQQRRRVLFQDERAHIGADVDTLEISKPAIRRDSRKIQPKSRLSRSARRLLRTPLFTSVAIITLAVGSGPTRRSSASSMACCSSRCRSTSRTGWSACGTPPPGSTSRCSTGAVALFRLSRGGADVRGHRAVGKATAVSVTGTGEPERVQALIGDRRHASRPARRADRSDGASRADDDSPRSRRAGDAHARLLAAEVRQRSRRHRPVDRRRRQAARDHRRPARRFQLPGPQPAAAPAVPVRSRQAASSATSATRGSRG